MNEWKRYRADDVMQTQDESHCTRVRLYLDGNEPEYQEGKDSHYLMEGWCKWDGCVNLTIRDDNESNDVLHICDLSDFINRLTRIHEYHMDWQRRAGHGDYVNEMPALTQGEDNETVV